MLSLKEISFMAHLNIGPADEYLCLAVNLSIKHGRFLTKIMFTTPQ